MAESLLITGTTRSEKYESLLPQIYALTTGETDFVANLANIAGALRQTFGFFWVGFYLVQRDELVLGPFQGPVACTRIRKGKAFAAQPGMKTAPCWCPMLKPFPDILPAAPNRNQKLLCPCTMPPELLSVCWMLTATASMILMKPMLYF
jgi:L-methionine (R)-S-oxide reductase